MGRLDGKVVFITGAARGQGRAHAVRFAQEGADVIAVDLAGQIDTVSYEMGTADELAETARQVRELGRRIVARAADVRDVSALRDVLQAGIDELGRLDAVIANAGIGGPFKPAWEFTDAEWQNMIDVNLTGVWQTTRVAIPRLIEQGQGGSITMTSSVGGLKAFPNAGQYNAAKHGVVGLARTLAVELAAHSIRVNTLHPTNVLTPMIDNPGIHRLFRPDLEKPTMDDVREPATLMNALPIPWVEPVDVANAALWLASDEARYVTGVALPVDAGSLQK